VSVIGELLGIPAADRPAFADRAQDWSVVLETLSPPAVDRADTAATVIADYLADLAEHRREHPADDLISALATSDGGDRLTAEELGTMSARLLKARSETTAGRLSNGLVALLAHPDQAARVRAEPALAIPAIEELLRYASPVQILSGRCAPDDLTIAGFDLS